jgi:dihydrofolate reductase
LFASLDGVVESPEKWQFPYYNEESGQALGSSMAGSDTLLLGRRTYEVFAAVWPGRGSDYPIGAYMNKTPKLVVSTTLTAASQRTGQRLLLVRLGLDPGNRRPPHARSCGERRSRGNVSGVSARC